MVQFTAMNEGIPHTPPEIAIANAMFYTRGVYEARDKSLLMHPEAKLERVSEGECENGSIIALKFLQENHGTQFDKLMLMKGYSPFTFNENHAWHVYFLAHDLVLNRWIAGSPANHKAYQIGSPFDMLIASSDLGAVIRGIQEKDGGKWPDPSEIQDSLGSYKAPDFGITADEGLYAKIFTFDYGLEVLDPDSIDFPEGLITTHPAFDMLEYSLKPNYQINVI